MVPTLRVMCQYLLAPCLDKDICCPFTIEAWFKPFDSQGERMILNKEDTWETANKDGLFQSAVARAKDDR